MRIIGGSLKGRKIIAPKNLPVRPTTDQAKESLFNVLNSKFDLDVFDVLDLFSGTGNISLEFLSRGVNSVTSIDANFNCFQFQKKTKQQYNLDNYFPYKGDVFRALKSVKKQFDVIFADPPYQLKNIQDLPDFILSFNLLKPGGVLIVEHGKETTYEHPHLIEHRKYGNVNFSFFDPENTSKTGNT